MAFAAKLVPHFLAAYADFDAALVEPSEHRLAQRLNDHGIRSKRSTQHRKKYSWDRSVVLDYLRLDITIPPRADSFLPLSRVEFTEDERERAFKRLSKIVDDASRIASALRGSRFPSLEFEAEAVRFVREWSVEPTSNLAELL